VDYSHRLLEGNRLATHARRLVTVTESVNRSEPTRLPIYIWQEPLANSVKLNQSVFPTENCLDLFSDGPFDQPHRFLLRRCRLSFFVSTISPERDSILMSSQ
jgi:hypothetical protein